MSSLPSTDLLALLAEAVRFGASDLHLAADTPPLMRLNGEILPLDETPLTAEQCSELLFSVLTQNQRARLEEAWELDFALQVETIGRFRGNAHYTRGAVGAAFRLIPAQIPELGALGHRASLFGIAEFQRGLVLVTGITGSGKSTTLASIVQHISRRRRGVIITIEDPIEYVLSNDLCLVRQREIGHDTKTFAEALRHALRQDPDVILVGEMRDPETISAAITAAETGHLVLATLHTIDAPKAIDRIVDAFPGGQQPQIIAQLANSLEAVVSQRLILRADNGGRVLASETLIANTAVRACIRERRWEQLVGLIEIGSKDGMNTLEESLASLVKTGQITPEQAEAEARDPDVLRSFLVPRHR
ncbi:MAG TPA: type IV pilus twitching motility protein PilT [Chthoniobacterales bacterium]